MARSYNDCIKPGLASYGWGNSALVQWVNVDVVFLSNWLTDFAWLLATGSAAGVAVRHWRLAATAAVGALAAVWVYFPSGFWLGRGWAVALGSAILLGLAFGPLRLREAFRVAVCFLLSGGVMAGMAFMADYWAAGSDSFASGPVAAGLLLCLVGIRYLWQLLERTQRVRGLYTLQIRLGSRRATVTALLDTGHDLRDPLTGAPVVVVEADALERVLPPEVRIAVSAGWEALEQLPGVWAARCRLVPYRAVGRPDGMLLALLADELAIRAPGGEAWRTVRGLIGLSPFPLQQDGVYRALLPERLAQRTGA